MSDEQKPKVIVLHRVHGALRSEVRPIVLEYHHYRKHADEQEREDEEKYSDELADVQRLEGNVLRVTRHSVKALSKGLDTYERERTNSARQKTDGAIEDFVDNSAKAASAAMKEASEIPMDIAEALNIRPYRKRIRRSLHQASRIIRLFRI